MLCRVGAEVGWETSRLKASYTSSLRPLTLVA